MRVLERIKWEDDGCVALRWMEMGQDCYRDPDYLFPGKELNLTFDFSLGVRCVVCGERADAHKEIGEPYCSQHMTRVCLCIREGVVKRNCTASTCHCGRPWRKRGPVYVPYLAIGALNRNLKVGVTLETRKDVRAAEQGATSMLPMIHVDDYAFNLKDAQRIEDLISGHAFGFKFLIYGPKKQDKVAQTYFPHPIYDPIPFFEVDTESGANRLREAFIKVKTKSLSLIRKYKMGPLDYDLISSLEYGEPTEPVYSEQIDTETLQTSDTVGRGKVATGIFGNLVATKGQILLVKNGNNFLCYNMKAARGLVEGSVCQVRLSAFTGSD